MIILKCLYFGYLLIGFSVGLVLASHSAWDTWKLRKVPWHERTHYASAAEDPHEPMNWIIAWIGATIGWLPILVMMVWHDRKKDG